MKWGLRIWMLVIILALSFLAIGPWQVFNKGVVIKSIEKNSTVFNEGLRQGMIVTGINGKAVNNLADYTGYISELFPEGKNISKSIKLTITTKDKEFIILADKAPQMTVSDLPKTNLKTGLDLSGGARALVRPANVTITSEELDNLISLTDERLNVYGISDISIRPVKDLEGNNFMLVEIAGATPSELQDLVGKQGKFEAKIGNETTFIGGEKDITSVCRNDATCSRIESCDQYSGGYACKFSFSITLSEGAAKRQADVTSKLGLNITDSGKWLDKKLDLYLDNQLVDSLLISEDLKGTVTTQISISGSGTGASQADALNEAKASMSKLQTILMTGSLPYKLEIVKLDSISPALGKQFTRNIIYLGLIAFVIVSIVLFIRYRKIKITLAVILTMFSEAFITLAIAALIKWNLDAPSIAGIIAGMGTGVDAQIVMIDESVLNLSASLKERIKRALFIIVAAFLTIVAAMLPLFEAGAGLLRGFALTTILGVTVGIVITRPAFADILKRLGE